MPQAQKMTTNTTPAECYRDSTTNSKYFAVLRSNYSTILFDDVTDNSTDAIADTCADCAAFAPVPSLIPTPLPTLALATDIHFVLNVRLFGSWQEMKIIRSDV